MNTKVSILICTYNCEKYIKNTIQTILDQTYKNWELLILDNNSKDSTKNILSKYKKNKKIKLFFSKNNKGAYSGLNYLIKKAKGKYIAIQDHDDLWHPNKLKVQVKFLNENKKYIGCGTNQITYYEKEKKIYFGSVKKDNFFACHTTLMFRNNNFYYNPNISFETDLYFMKKIICKDELKIYNINKFYSVHIIRKDQNNLTIKTIKENSLIEIIKIIKINNRSNIKYFLKIIFIKYFYKIYKIIKNKKIKKIKNKNKINYFKKYLKVD